MYSALKCIDVWMEDAVYIGGAFFVPKEEHSGEFWMHGKAS